MADRSLRGDIEKFGKTKGNIGWVLILIRNQQTALDPQLPVASVRF